MGVAESGVSRFPDEFSLPGDCDIALKLEKTNKLYTINFNKLFFMVSYFIYLLNDFFDDFSTGSSCNF